jgi:hypothetical protein
VRVVDVRDGFHLREIAFGDGIGAALGRRETRDRRLEDQPHVERRRRAEVGIGRVARIAALREHVERRRHHVGARIALRDDQPFVLHAPSASRTAGRPTWNSAASSRSDGSRESAA